MDVNTYLIFNGRCEEALNFYRAALGAEVLMMLRMKDAPPGNGMDIAPGLEDKIMHARIRIGNTVLMASDGPIGEGVPYLGVSLSINAKDATEAARYFNALAEEGQVRMPLSATFWSPAFGMLADRFGVAWMVNVDQAPPA